MTGNNVFFFLFFVGISSALAWFLDLGAQAAIPNQTKMQRAILRILTMGMAVCTTVQISVMLGLIEIAK